MAKTITTRFGLTRWSASTDAPLRTDFDTSFGQIESIGAIDRSGTLAARPAAGIVGTLYTATDTGAMYRDDGTQWRTIVAGVWTDYVPTYTGVAASTTFARFMVVGRLVQVQSAFSMTSVPTGSFSASVPANAYAYPSSPVVGSVLGNPGGAVTTGVVQLTTGTFVFSSSGAPTWNATAPGTWVATNIVKFQATYETP